MPFLNVEIKARTNNSKGIRDWLMHHGADFRGTDYQTDTYFNVSQGRLKLREGNIENNLIFYQRDDTAGPKSSSFELVPVPDAKSLKDVLRKAIGIKVIIKKQREIYFIGNVKFHLDHVPGMGEFVEIEASNLQADLREKELHGQCNNYLKEFGIKEEDLVVGSYSDMVGRGLDESNAG
jgi:adenylate cyclase, class 2